MSKKSKLRRAMRHREKTSKPVIVEEPIAPPVVKPVGPRRKRKRG